MELTPNNMEQNKQELSKLQAWLQKLNWLEEQFNNPPLKSKRQLTIDELTKLGSDGARVVQYILELDIGDNVRNVSKPPGAKPGGTAEWRHSNYYYSEE
jgi:hypothetical protein